MDRRAFLGASAAVLALPGLGRAATPESADFIQKDLVLGGDKRIARRSLVLIPKHAPKGEKLRVLVLLHGLGETGNEMLGIHAWGERYGLVSCYERLRRPPVARVQPKQKWFTDETLASVNADLAKRPFRGMVLVCPVTPNPSKVGPAAKTLDRYAEWIEKTLLPAVYDEATCAKGPANTGLDGCSLGGYVGMEVFLRKPELFGTFGGVQAAFNVPSGIRYAEQLKKAIDRVGARKIHVETSSQDPFKKANQALAKRLRELGVDPTLSVIPGPHNQPWLKEIGTLDMLLWHDRQLGKSK
jgi:enterochelin esterase-like enzyme